MATITTVSYERLFADQLYNLVELTQDTSVVRMQRIRASVLLTRAYMDGLRTIFAQVRNSHEREVAKMLAAGGAHKNTQKTKQSNSVCLLLSPSGKFSGPLITQVTQEFSTYIASSSADVLVVGETGKELLASKLKDRTVQFIPLNLEHPSPEEVKELLQILRQYENITVFTGKFHSLLTQTPTAVNISGYDSLQTEQQPARAVDPDAPNFLFEPDLEKIVTFFNLQVTASLFRQTVEESKLANLGSRIMTLESARGGISREIQALDKKLRQLERRHENKKQFARLSGMQIWR